MDDLTVAVLKAEVAEDCRVLRNAASLARERFGSGSDPELEASAFQISRFYNVVEQLALRIAKAFENNIDDEHGWHMELVRRLSIEIPGVRPPLFSGELISDLQELRSFRHVVRHAYDLILKKEKLLSLVDAAQRAASSVPVACGEFFKVISTHA
ncbi:MAG TPA: hypothetical protein VGK48_00860 [Terriglobia bacterium]|jgi:hypothetical protein